MIVRESLVGYGISTGTSPELAQGDRRTYPGLTAQETILLQALIELREAAAPALAQRIGLPDGPSLHAALDRLVSLRYALRRDDAAGVRYWPVAQAMG